LLTPSDITEAVDWLNNPSEKRLPFGVMDLGWQFAEPKTQHLEPYVENQQIWWWQDRLGMLVMVDKKEGSETWARIRMLACEEEHYFPCLLDAHSFTAQAGYPGITWKVPLIPGIEDKLSQASYKRDKDYTILIFEKHHPDV
jgi:hypothetical protein